MKWLMKIKEIFVGEQHYFSICYAKKLRILSEQNIDDMIANLDVYKGRLYPETKEIFDEYIFADGDMNV